MISLRFRYSIHYKCACAGPDGKPAGRDCPKLWRADRTWNPPHGSCGWAARVPTSGGTKLVKRYVFPSKREAEAAAGYAGKLLDLAGGDVITRARIGDMIAAAKRGIPLPAAEDVARRLGLGLDPSAPGITVAEWLDTWLAGKRRTRRPRVRCAPTRCTAGYG